MSFQALINSEIAIESVRNGHANERKSLGIMSMKVSRFGFVMTIAMIVLLAFPITVVAQPPSKPLRIAGFLTDYRFSAFDPIMAQGLTDLIVFSAELNEHQ